MGPPAAYDIPFNRVHPAGLEARYVADALASGHLSGDGAFTSRAERLLESVLGSPRVMLTPSCTDALEMAALVLGVGPGDEVIVPTFTFTSTATAFALRGAVPVFVDSRPDTLNLDEAALEAVITPRTRVITVVHYAGVGCQMDAILRIADRHGLAVVEDNAHGLFGRYRGRPLGSFGILATQSFHETKNVTCGEGGALVINDGSLTARAEVLREKGTNRAAFFRGEVDKYTWVDQGSSFLASELQAAFLVAQLEAREAIQRDRMRIWDRYSKGLAAWAADQGATLPVIPDGCEHPAHMFYLLLPSLEARTMLIGHLRSRRVLAVSHYIPLNVSPMGATYGARRGDCPVAEDVSDRLLRLPLFAGLSDAEQERVIEAILDFRV